MNDAFASVVKITEKEEHKTLDSYQQEILSLRIAETVLLNEQLQQDSIDGETDLYLDFTFSSEDETGTLNLVEQLKDNYQVNFYKKGSYWFIEATSRPYVVNLNSIQRFHWVTFMNQLAFSNSSIFSVWSLTDPISKKVWSNEDVYSGS